MDQRVNLTIEDPRAVRFLQQLTDEPMPTISDRTFENLVVCLDGRRFKNCTFKGCTIRILLGWFDLVECKFPGATKFEIGGLAAGAWNFVKSFDNVDVRPVPPAQH